LAKQLSNGVVVIGLGRFGRSLALELMGAGEEVLGVDADPRIVQELAGRLTHVVQADSTNEEAMRQLGVADFGRAVIAIGTDIEASILSASVVLDLGVRDVWAKAISAAHKRILTQIGAHHVVRPEHDMGQRVAHLVKGDKMIDYVEFDEGYAFAKTNPPAAMLGRSLSGYGVRQAYGITVVAVKPAGGTFEYAHPDTVIREGDQVIVSGPQAAVERFAQRS